MNEKQALRARARATRVVVPGAALEVASHFPLELAKAGTVVAGTVAMQTELDSLPLLRRLAQAGCTLALPRTPRRGQPLTFHRWHEGDALFTSAFGVQEPGADAPLLVPDVLLVPLLAFDATGARLGYGGGFYDVTLTALRARRQVLAVGLAYASQEVPRVPTEPHDQHLDAVSTERGFRRFSGLPATQ